MEYPKLYWDADGIEKKIHSPEDEDKAKAAGWADVPPGVKPNAPAVELVDPDAPVRPTPEPTPIAAVEEPTKA